MKPDQQDNTDDNMDEVVDSVSSDVAQAYESLEQTDDTNHIGDDDEAGDDTGDNTDGSDTSNVDDNADTQTGGTGDDDPDGDGTGDTDKDTGGDDEAGKDDETGDDNTDADTSSKTVPDHWAEKDKEMFSKQSPEAQEFLLRRHKEMEGHLTQKSQETAEFTKTYEPVAQVMAPFKAAMQQANLTEGQVIQRWAAAENMLNTRPENAIKQLAQTYKVDLVALAGSQSQGSDSYQTDNGSNENGQTNPVIEQLQQQVSTLSQSVMTQAQQEAVNKIEAFAKEADDQGNLKRPFFEELEGDIAQIAAVARTQGKPIDLQTFYEQAVWSNPSTREKQLSSQRQAEDAKKKDQDRQRAENKRKKANKAKRASSTVKPSTDVNSSGGGDGNKNASLGQDVAAAFEKLESVDRV